MTNKLTKGVEISANIAIIIVALLLGVVLVKHWLLTGTQVQSTSRQRRMVAAGEKLPLPGVNWAENRRTLLLALSTRCHFCTESAEFYKRLAEARAQLSDIRMVAVLPQQAGEGQAYLERLGVKIDEVRQSSLDSVGVTGTPTLIMVDGDGAATEMWVGKLPADKEAEVLSQLE